MSQANQGRAALALLLCGALIVAVALGIRHSFGLFLQPVSMANGWGRDVFALAIAVQARLAAQGVDRGVGFIAGVLIRRNG